MDPRVGVPHPLTFYSPYTGLSVSCEVSSIDGSVVSESIVLQEQPDVSSSSLFVYVGYFTPSATGWYISHYQASRDSALVSSDVMRLQVVDAASESSSSSVTTTVGSESTSISASGSVSGITGTLKFTVRS